VALSCGAVGITPERVIAKRRKTMTTQTETKTKKAPPAEVAYKLDAAGKPIYSTRTPVWGSKSGKAKNFSIGADRYVIFPNTPKPAAQGKGA
jgi:hypothetical protein